MELRKKLIADNLPTPRSFGLLDRGQLLYAKHQTSTQNIATTFQSLKENLRKDYLQWVLTAYFPSVQVYASDGKVDLLKKILDIPDINKYLSPLELSRYKQRFFDLVKDELGKFPDVDYQIATVRLIGKVPAEFKDDLYQFAFSQMHKPLIDHRFTPILLYCIQASQHVDEQYRPEFNQIILEQSKEFLSKFQFRNNIIPTSNLSYYQNFMNYLETDGRRFGKFDDLMDILSSLNKRIGKTLSLIDQRHEDFVGYQHELQRVRTLMDSLMAAATPELRVGQLLKFMVKNNEDLFRRYDDRDQSIPDFIEKATLPEQVNFYKILSNTDRIINREGFPEYPQLIKHLEHRLDMVFQHAIPAELTQLIAAARQIKSPFLEQRVNGLLEQNKVNPQEYPSLYLDLVKYLAVNSINPETLRSLQQYLSEIPVSHDVQSIQDILIKRGQEHAEWSWAKDYLLPKALAHYNPGDSESLSDFFGGYGTEIHQHIKQAIMPHLNVGSDGIPYYLPDVVDSPLGTISTGTWRLTSLSIINDYMGVGHTSEKSMHDGRTYLATQKGFSLDYDAHRGNGETFLVWIPSSVYNRRVDAGKTEVGNRSDVSKEVVVTGDIKHHEFKIYFLHESFLDTIQPQNREKFSVLNVASDGYTYEAAGKRMLLDNDFLVATIEQHKSLGSPGLIITFGGENTHEGLNALFSNPIFSTIFQDHTVPQIVSTSIGRQLLKTQDPADFTNFYEINDMMLSPDFKPRDIIDYLKINPQLKALYESRTGIKEGYTLEMHTEMVMNQFKDIFAFGPSNDYDRFFLKLLAVHDLGKTKTTAYQHQETIKLLDLLPPGYFSPEEKKLAIAIINGDPIGEYMQHNLTLDEAIAKIRSMNETSGMPLGKFFSRYLTVYYQCDVSAYTSRAHYTSTEGDPVYGKATLDSLFEINDNKFTFAKGRGDMHRLEFYNAGEGLFKPLETAIMTP